ncbi:MAG: right-handed parallel beta-helix repeat-containing protein, partial [Bdellovibrionales bacterium]|nr:right-handed parallel beta-helix repeat-containing protein [Bdellovibrionales bacterium]
MGEDSIELRDFDDCPIHSTIVLGQETTIAGRLRPDPSGRTTEFTPASGFEGPYFALPDGANLYVRQATFLRAPVVSTITAGWLDFEYVTIDGGGSYNLHTVSAIDVSDAQSLLIDRCVIKNWRGESAVTARSVQEVTVKKSSFISNLAVGGGALHLINSSLEVRDSRFERNSAFFGGGAIFIDSAEYATLYRNTFLENSVTYQLYGGGAIFAYAVERINSEVNKFVRNDSDGMGGAMLLTRVPEHLLINLDSYIDNHSTNCGGALALLEAAEVEIVSRSAGGFSGNSASCGGALYLEESVVEVSGRSVAETGLGEMIFWHNTADSKGGAINAVDSYLRVSSGGFGGNIASDGDGGAISLLRGAAYLPGNSFEYNQAEGKGGAIFAADVSSLEIDHSRFLNNSLVVPVWQSQGAALYVQSPDTMNTELRLYHNNFLQSHSGANQVLLRGAELFGEFVDNIVFRQGNGQVEPGLICDGAQPNLEVDFINHHRSMVEGCGPLLNSSNENPLLLEQGPLTYHAVYADSPVLGAGSDGRNI